MAGGAAADVLLLAAATIGLLLPRGEELRIARQIGLRVAGAERHLLVRLRRAAHVLVAVIAHVVAHVGTPPSGRKNGVVCRNWSCAAAIRRK